RGRRTLEDEATLRADRHDHDVLDHLRFHQPEDLGAEILHPVGPAQAAARDPAPTHVNSFHAWGTYEDLELRAGLGQPRDLRRIELDRQVSLRITVGRALEEIRPQARL